MKIKKEVVGDGMKGMKYALSKYKEVHAQRIGKAVYVLTSTFIVKMNILSYGELCAKYSRMIPLNDGECSTSYGKTRKSKVVSCLPFNPVSQFENLKGYKEAEEALFYLYVPYKNRKPCLYSLCFSDSMIRFVDTDITALINSFGVTSIEIGMEEEDPIRYKGEDVDILVCPFKAEQFMEYLRLFSTQLQVVLKGEKE